MPVSPADRFRVNEMEWTSVEAYFDHLSSIETNKEKGDLYEGFSLEYIKNRYEVENIWLWKDIPDDIRKKLKLSRKDIGVDILYYKNDNYCFVQCKFTGSLGNLQDAKTGITRFITYARQMKESIRHTPIIITTYTGISKDELLQTADDFIFILRESQLDEFGLRALASLRKEPQKPVSSFLLKDYQRQDFRTLTKSTRKMINENYYVSNLFQAPMGYGKTVMIAHYSSWLLDKTSFNVIVIVAPLLKINQQNFDTIYKQNYGKNRGYYMFDSHDPDEIERIENIPCSTNVELWESFRKEEHNGQIVFTTYKSLAKLLQYLDENTFFIYDELHKLPKEFYALDQDRTGFTATPTNELVAKFSLTVERTLGWAINEQKCLTDYQICTVSVDELLEDGPQLEDLAMQKVERDVQILTRIIRDGHSSKLLYICNRQKDAKYVESRLKDILPTTEVKTIVGTDSTRSRSQKEKILAEAKTAILCSVKIYREGANLPWLDAVYFGVNISNEIEIVQTAGRALRVYPGKDIARFFIPVITKNGGRSATYIDTDNVEYGSMINFIHYLSIHDPSVFDDTALGKKRKIPKLMNLLIKGKKGRTMLKQIEDEQILIDISEQINILTHHKTGSRIFDKTWKNMTGATILRKSSEGKFSAGLIKSYGEILAEWSGKTGGTPGQTMSREITEFWKRKGYIESLGRGLYQVSDSDTILELIGPIPDDFPVE